MAGAPDQVDGQPRPVSISGVIYKPATINALGGQATPVTLGVSSARQIMIQNNSGQPINRSYTGQAGPGDTVIANGQTWFDTVTSTNLSLYGAAAYIVNGGAGGVVVEVYS